MKIEIDTVIDAWKFMNEKIKTPSYKSIRKYGDIDFLFPLQNNDIWHMVHDYDSVISRNLDSRKIILGYKNTSQYAIELAENLKNKCYLIVLLFYPELEENFIKKYLLTKDQKYHLLYFDDSLYFTENRIGCYIDIRNGWINWNFIDETRLRKKLINLEKYLIFLNN